MVKTWKPIKVGRIALYLALGICSLIFLFPLYLALVNSLNSWYAVPTFVPRGWHWENYLDATRMIDFWNYAKNSVFLSLIVVTTSTLSSAMIGFAFARLPAPGKNALFMVVLSTMMLPAIVTQVPTYILFYRLKLLNSFLPWLIWGIGGNAFFIFLYRQFFAAIPVELEEAALIDGCSYFRIFWNIFLPVSLPAVATTAILMFHSTWNDVTGPFMYLQQAKYPLATALSMIGYRESGSNQIISQVSVAAGLMLAIPVVATFFVGQRYIVQGIVTTGIKG